MDVDSYHGFTLFNICSPSKKKSKQNQKNPTTVVLFGVFFFFSLVSEILLCKLKSKQIKESAFKRNFYKSVEKGEGRKHVSLQKQTNLEVTEKPELQ